jgi:hypothetical protein
MEALPAMPLRDFADSTLWRISAFERVRVETGTSGFQRLDGPTVLSSTLLADLHRSEIDLEAIDVLELVAACMRHQEAALIYLVHEGFVWPVTLFPDRMLYHSPRDLDTASAAGLADLRHKGMEPPGLRPPGHYASERVGKLEHYRPLAPLLWQLAVRGPRRTLLREIGGTAAYRMLPGRLPDEIVPGGALRSAIERLRFKSVALRDMSTWPGLSVERASRLLNALYLFSSLMITRSSSAAKEEPAGERSRFGFFKPR